MRGRVFVFIDAANILYSQQTLKWRVDYEKLKQYFETECNLKGLYFYTGKVGENQKQDAFIKKLESLGYKVRSKEVKRIKISKDAYQLKGNLDAELIIDALKNENNFDTCVLMSGDSDFAPLLDELKERNKWVVVMSSKRHVSRELLDRAKYLNIKKLEAVISYKNKIPLPKQGEV